MKLFIYYYLRKSCFGEENGLRSQMSQVTVKVLLLINNVTLGKLSINLSNFFEGRSRGSGVAVVGPQCDTSCTAQS